MTKPSPRSKPPSWLIVPALTLLTACHAETSEPTNSCGTLFVYDEKTEAIAAQEYQAMKTASVYPVTRQLIDDYGVARDTIRACGK